MSAHYRFNKLHFFDKNGIELDFNFIDGIWYGKIHLPKVSINLNENNTIFILEELEDSTGNVFYGKPHTDQSITDNIININWSDKNEKSFSFIEIDNPLNKEPSIKLLNSLQKTFIDSSNDTFSLISGRIKTNNLVSEPIRIDFVFNSNEENSYTNNISIKDKISEFVNIEIYGESVGEDERFTTMLSNLGEYITEREEFIFRNSDINEDFPDYQILNKKRKELIIELHNIKPYFASYKGIINIIKFFGYYELKLKEYWKNVDTGKFILQDVNQSGEINLDKPNYLLEAPYKKTSYFGLYYEINRVVQNEYDEKGLPILEDVNIFSNEEILIKLFGLKNYIKERNIGGVSKIIDIIGEVTFFNRYKIINWHDKTEILVYDHYIKPVFEVYPTNGYIQDLRPLLNDYSTCPIPTSMNLSSQIQIGTYNNCFLGYFNDLNQNKPEYLDEPNIPVGFPVRLTNKTFDITWENVDITWIKALNITPIITFDNIGSTNHYELKWIITKQANLNDSRTFVYEKRDKITDSKIINTILPYNGKYDVTLVLYGFNNIISKHTEQGCITVDLKEADFICWFKYRDPYLQRWNTNNSIISDIKSSWISNDFISNNENFYIGENDVKYRSFKMINYLNVLINGVVNVGIKDIIFNDYLDATWDDMMFSRWNDMKFNKEKLARFLITKISSNGYLQIGKSEIQLDQNYNIHDFTRLAKELSDNILLDIKSMSYIARPMNLTPYFVDVTSKYEGSSGNLMVGARNGVEFDHDSSPNWNDLYDIKFEDNPIKFDNMDHFYYAKGSDEPYTFDNSMIYKSEFTVPLMIPVFMTIDNSKMPGKTKVIWTITDDMNQTLLNHDSLYMVYRFDKEGQYTISTKIYDSNNNENNITKSKIVKVLRGNKFLIDKYR